uniref:WGS project CBMI000000000 data, contig CS3069_c002545 n=1 Tax=Fusarium clavum TaxID=2594811 RepID=A0A090MH36_9HYPO|nr:unnamed protein product [Fusarium clavum]CEG05852.1 unnamed protein product [Fusarium clavum]
MAQGAADVNPYGMLPGARAHWGPWWSPGDVPFPNILEQEPHFAQPNYTLDQDTSTQWDSPMTSIHSYSAPSSLTDVASLDVSPSHNESRRGYSSTQLDQRKRKPSTASVATPKTQVPATKSTRRASTKKTTTTEPAADAASQKPKRSSRSRAAAKQPQPTQEEQEYGDEDADADPEKECSTQSKKVQERNRIASNKFRVKKREDAIKLRADEEEMERANCDLTHCVSDLTLQVYELKMKLLQHTECNCTLIQEYIATEAQKYIKDLGEGKHPNATPALPPQHMYPRHV